MKIQSKRAQGVMDDLFGSVQDQEDQEIGIKKRGVRKETGVPIFRNPAWSYYSKAKSCWGKPDQWPLG